MAPFLFNVSTIIFVIHSIHVLLRSVGETLLRGMMIHKTCNTKLRLAPRGGAISKNKQQIIKLHVKKKSEVIILDIMEQKNNKFLNNYQFFFCTLPQGS